MSELDRWGDSAAVALLDEVSGAETEEALAMVRNGDSGEPGQRPRYALLALAAAAVVVLVAGVALIKSRDAEEVEPPLATPPSSSPAPTPAPTTAPATSPATVASEPPTSTPPSTTPATSEPTTTPPVSTVPPAPADVPPLADQPDFGGASKVAYARDGVIIVLGSRGDGSPVLWQWHDTTTTWASSPLPGDNSYVPIAFASDQVGFAFVDGYLQRTTDGGASWGRIDIASPSGGGVSVIELAVGANLVHALAVDQDGAMTFRLYTMALDGSSFAASPVEIPPPAGGEPSASFAFAGDAGWMAVTSRTLMGAAEFADGQWSEAPDVTCVNGGVYFASSGQNGDLVRSCDSGYMGSDGSVPEGTQLEVSSDGGETFRPVPLPDRSPDSPEFVTLLARPAVGTIVIQAQDGSGVIFGDDGGNGRPLGLPAGSFVSGLSTDSGGLWVAVGSDSNGDQKVWVSRDAGATWTG